MQMKTRKASPANGTNGDAKERVRRQRKERDEIVKNIADWMAKEHPVGGVDVLLTRPIEALRLGLAVAARAGQIKPAEAKRCELALVSVCESNRSVIKAVDDICRAAMCARKRGQLKSARRVKGEVSNHG